MNSLLNNIIDVIKEEQIKLGYCKERIRLYYPLTSLNSMLGIKADCAEMERRLNEFFFSKQDVLGKVEVSYKAERFCINLPEQASEYVHEHTPSDGFLYDFIGTISKHGVTIDEVLAQFNKYSDKVHFEEMTNEDFDYLIYFEDGQPDSYFYCLTQEEEHLIYHRFTKEDYYE